MAVDGAAMIEPLIDWIIVNANNIQIFFLPPHFWPEPTRQDIQALILGQAVGLGLITLLRTIRRGNNIDNRLDLDNTRLR